MSVSPPNNSRMSEYFRNLNSGLLETDKNINSSEEFDLSIRYAIGEKNNQKFKDLDIL